jgi:hypothetical protein
MPVVRTGLNCLRKEKNDKPENPGQKLRKKYGE